ncbi:hypothetical protein [Mucilaginibacter sp. L196]|uniref:hypothetical protein n=1 Tax=Mucilaginibacter sp. L196 TaxID=1641870 RepID=UPI00131D2314|nr:hypothetical protein [Mucilaginibacter sp. L196]
MKIIFICSSFELGRDGVGDYVRRLSFELIRQGHIIAVIALNDKYIKDQIVENQHIENVDLSALRLSADLPLRSRLKTAKKYIDEFNPNWISLQFVIYGYHQKGLPLWLNKLATLGKDRMWHVMFHELWLGIEINSSTKHRILGGVQKIIIKGLIKSLKPKVIHTHTLLYQQELLGIGVEAQHLPLFGNIPLINSIKEPKQLIIDNNCIKLVLFGHLHPNTPISDFAKELSEYAIEKDLNVSLTLIGNCGKEQQSWIDAFNSLKMNVIVLGKQPASYVSETLASSSVGISTTPVALLEKSGSVAAMREHGLFVICVPSLWHPKLNNNINLSNGIAVYKKGNLKSLFTKTTNQLPVNNILGISSLFIDSLFNDTK